MYMHYTSIERYIHMKADLSWAYYFPEKHSDKYVFYCLSWNLKFFYLLVTLLYTAILVHVQLLLYSMHGLYLQYIP